MTYQSKEFYIQYNMDQQYNYDFAIIGGGVYGLSIAYHLAKTQTRIALFQRYTIGHGNGSSHGPQRITRSAYEHQFYRDLNTLGLKQYWPEVEQVLNSKFVFPNEFISYEERKENFQKDLKVAETAKTKIKVIKSQQISKIFNLMPQIHTQNPAIVDFEAGMIASDDYISRLAEYLKTLPNVVLFQNTIIKEITQTKENVRLTTEAENINATKVIVAAGRWVLDLFPELSKILHVRKQYLTYYKLKNPQLYQFGRIPSFGYHSQSLRYYTTPDRKGLGFKIGSHNTEKTNKSEASIEKEIREIHKKVGLQLFKDSFLGVNKEDQCFYTVTKTEDFIIDWIDPQTNQILICSCCSGHGFKFSPVIGKIISDIITTDKSLDIFEKYRYLCQIPYHLGVNLG